MNHLHQQIHAHLRMLAGTIGERPTGTRPNREAQRYITNTLARAGVQTTSQEFDFREWNAQDSFCRIAGTKLPLSPNPFSPPVRGSGSLIPLATEEELKQADLTGRIALLSGELTKAPLMPRNYPFYRDEMAIRVLDTLEQKNPLAVITITPRSDQAVHIIIDGDLSLPSCTVTTPVGEILLKNRAENMDICIQTTDIPGKSANIIGTIPGSGRKILLLAHLDTKWGTPGASDNAAGVAVLLELARILQEKPVDAEVICIFVNGEEAYSAPGELEYLKQNPPSPEETIIAINIDGVGLKPYATSISYYACPEMLSQKIARIVSLPEYLLQPCNPWPQGDHMIFAMHQIPAVALTSDASGEVITGIIHTEKDKISLLDEEEIIHCTRTVEKIIRSLSP